MAGFIVSVMPEPDLTWKEPPASESPQGPVQRIVDNLRAKPGEWALVYDAAPYYPASRQPKGYARLHNLGCEVRSRTNGDGTAQVYARWPEAS
jgi:hypothetical protein